MLTNRASRFIAACLALSVAACSGEPEAPPQAPPVPVDAITVTAQPVVNYVELPGRVEAVRTAEVRARTNGIIEARTYQEGSDVRAGQPLFRIDPRELEASLASSNAQLQRARATAVNAQQDVQRYEGLVAQQAISEQEFDAAQARYRQAQADVAQAEAQVRTARLSRDYATVAAPISGRVGRAEVTEGALVSGTEGTLLTKIEQLHPIYVNFSQSNSALLALRRDAASGNIDLPDLSRVEVTLAFEDGTPYPAAGHLDFLDLSVDQTTGTVSLRAEFPNRQQSLIPGQFVRARIAAGINPQGIMIPQRAVTIQGDRATVLLVGADNKAVERQVTVGDLQGGQWVIREGLRAGEKVIVNGLQKAKAGALVQITKLDGRPVAPPRGQRGQGGQPATAPAAGPAARSEYQ